MKTRNRLILAGLGAALFALGCPFKPDDATTATSPEEQKAQAAAEEQRITCTESGVIARAKQGENFVDNWFSKDTVNLWGDPINVRKAVVPTSGCDPVKYPIPADASWTLVQDSTSMACTLFNQVTGLRPSLRCVGFGVLVTIVKHNGFTGTSAFLVSDFGVDLSAANRRATWSRALARDRRGLIAEGDRLGVGALVRQALADAETRSAR